MVGEAQHVLEEIDSPDEVLFVVQAGASHGLHEPESAHAEGTFSSAHA